MEEKSYRRKHGEKTGRKNLVGEIIAEESGGEIMKEKSWSRHNARHTLEQKSWRRNHGGEILQERSRRKNQEEKS